MDISNAKLCDIQDIDPKVMDLVCEKFYGHTKDSNLKPFINSINYICANSIREIIDTWEAIKPHLMKPRIKQRFLMNICDKNPVISNLMAYKSELDLGEYFSHKRFKGIKSSNNVYPILYNFRKFLIIPNKFYNPTDYIIGILDLGRTIIIENQITGHKFCDEIILPSDDTLENLISRDAYDLEGYSDDTLENFTVKNPEVHHKDILIIPTYYTWMISHNVFKEILTSSDLGIRNKLFTFHPSYGHSIKKISFL